MFCPNCGHGLNGNEAFCRNCGRDLTDVKSKMNANKQKNNVNDFIKKCKDFLIPIFDKIKNFTNQRKKQIAIVCSCIFTLLTIVLLFNKFYDFTKLSWDENAGDFNVTHTEPTTLTLYVTAYDEDENPINNITFESEVGEIKSSGTKVEWTLPNEGGKYTITAKAPSGKKIKKEVSVVILKEENSLAGLYEDEVDDTTTDSDNDGILNAKEKELGTDPYLIDTDRDGLSDFYEINVSFTDPLKKDTDGDTLNDGDELDLNLNPLKVDSKGDGINDSQRQLNYVIENSQYGVTLEINGKGNIASSTIDVFKNTAFSSRDGLLDKVYNFYTDGTLTDVTVKIKYDLSEVQSSGLSEDNLTLYYFNEETKQLEAMPTAVDKKNKTLIVELKHFSKYVIGDKDVVLVNNEAQIMFVIDNSVSMYSTAQMIEAGYSASTGAIGNDTEFKRLTLTNNLVSMFTGNYKFGVAEFSGDYVNLAKFTNDTNKVKTSVNSMKSYWNSNGSGTNIITALKSGINEFSEDENSHYLLLLTDGKNTKGDLSLNKTTIINNAKEKDVKICVIGLGSEIDTEDLNEIAESTGCDYYNASDSSALDEIYSIVGADINYNYVDTDGDNKADGMIIANSGFIVNRDGFSFSNFASGESEDGICYGMATFANLYYRKQLPLTLGAKDNSKFYLGMLSYVDLNSNGYNLNNTYFANNKTLYDFNVTTTPLKYYLYDVPGDYRDRIENDTWMIKTEYYNNLVKIGATIRNKDQKDNANFSKYQSALLNIENDSFIANTTKDENQLLNALWRLFITQAKNESTSFLSQPDKAYSELFDNLTDGNPIVTGINGHAINSIKLIQDIDNPNKFKIEVYDNNYAGETRYIEVTRSKFNKIQLNYTAWVNEYEYTFMYDANNDGVLEKHNVSISHLNEL